MYLILDRGALKAFRYVPNILEIKFKYLHDNYSKCDFEEKKSF